MRTLIVCTTRSGGNALCDRIAKEHNIPAIFNPFDGTGRSSIPKDNSDFVVKTDICHPSDEALGVTYPVNIIKRVEFYTSLIEEYRFSDVILLDRQDNIEQIESYAWRILKYKTPLPHDYTVEKYNYQSFLVDNDIIVQAKNILQDNRVNLKRLGYKLGIDIKYYEDLFDSKSIARYRQSMLI